jgi:ABC-type transporter Mla MlaB component
MGTSTEPSGTLVTAASSSEQDGGVSTQGKEVDGVTPINGGEEVQPELETRFERWESTQGAGQLSSAQQTIPFFSRQVSQVSTDTTLSLDSTLSSDTMLSLDTTLSSETTLSSTQQTKDISTELGARTGNTSDIVTVAGSSKQYNDGASVQTQEGTVDIAIVQGGEDMQRGSITDQVSTQGVRQSSSEETNVDLEQVSQITSVQLSYLMRAANCQSARASTLISESSPKRRQKKRPLATIQI